MVSFQHIPIIIYVLNKTQVSDLGPLGPLVTYCKWQNPILQFAILLPWIATYFTDILNYRKVLVVITHSMTYMLFLHIGSYISPHVLLNFLNELLVSNFISFSQRIK